MTSKKKFFAIITGNAPKSEQIWYALFIAVFFAFICAIAIALYPTDYSILDNHISNQGSITKNPAGHKFWNVGMFIEGILLVPFALYMYRSYQSGWPTVAKFALVSGILAAIGYSLVGVFPEEVAIVHMVVACFAFFGLLANYYLHFLIFWRQFQRTNFKWPNSWRFHTLYHLLNFGFFTTIIMPNADSANASLNWDPRIFEFPLWEWLLLTIMYIWMFGITILVDPFTSEKK